MFYKVGHGHVFTPAAMPHTFRKQLTMRVRAATNATQHVSQMHSIDLKNELPKTESGLSSIVRQFVSQIGEWWQPSTQVAEEEELTVEEMTQQLKDELEDSAVQLDKESVSELSKAARPNIWKFLQPVASDEIQKSRFMASLANATYFISNITSKSLLMRYGLDLVTTSLKCKQPARNAKLVDDAVMAGDGMAVATADIPDCEEESKVISEEMSNIVTAMNINGPADNLSTNKVPTSIKSEPWKVHRRMGSMAGSIYSQSLAQLARQITIAASVSQSAVSVTLTRVMNLLQAALRPDSWNSKSMPSVAYQEASQQSIQNQDAFNTIVTPAMMSKCPTEWFVCDDEKTKTRYFCIQGTDNFESWQTNLAFDPVPFEDDNLGIRVHRGIYEAALGLYGLFVPLIKDHLKSGSTKKISFTGHSLGGAIATILLMMLVYRGIIPPENVGQVFSFGGVACVCDACDCSSCGLESFFPNSNNPHSENTNILQRLGLPLNTVVNIIMHKDIVPRAFASDYSLVANLLRSWSHSFRKHHCLTITGRSLLYNFIGEIRVLQPDAESYFVNNEGYHPMLPQQAGLFRIIDPDEESLELKEKTMKEALDCGEIIGSEVANKKDAFLALMDNPHPLDMLSDAKAYGVSGAISRYHNPGHYALGLRSTIHKGLQTKEQI